MMELIGGTFTSNMSSAGNAFNGNLGNGAVFTSSGSTLTTGSITIMIQ